MYELELFPSHKCLCSTSLATVMLQVKHEMQGKQ